VITQLLTAVIEACRAYCLYVQLKRETRIDEIEDQIDRAAAIGDATSKLQTRRLLLRKKRYVEQLGTIRSATDTSD
jgi:hypothetical protein